MRYIGNYADWIQQEWIDHWMSNTGLKRPGQGDTPYKERTKAEGVGYDTSQTFWHYFSQDNCPFTIDKFPVGNEKPIIWWVTKMLPGNFIPMHIDDYEGKKVNCTRYWLALQDYESGHIFVYKDDFVKDYKKGDLWAFADADEVHGACNISFSTRLIFLFTTYDNPPA